MKKLLIIVCILLSACSKTIYPWELQEAKRICENKQGIYSIITDFRFKNIVICNDGYRDYITLKTPAESTQ